MNTRHSTTATL